LELPNISQLNIIIINNKQKVTNSRAYLVIFIYGKPYGILYLVFNGRDSRQDEEAEFSGIGIYLIDLPGKIDW